MKFVEFWDAESSFEILSKAGQKRYEDQKDKKEQRNEHGREKRALQTFKPNLIVKTSILGVAKTQSPPQYINNSFPVVEPRLVI